MTQIESRSLPDRIRRRPTSPISTRDSWCLRYQTHQRTLLRADSFPATPEGFPRTVAGDSSPAPRQCAYPPIARRNFTTWSELRSCPTHRVRVPVREPAKAGFALSSREFTRWAGPYPQRDGPEALMCMRKKKGEKRRNRGWDRTEPDTEAAHPVGAQSFRNNQAK